MGATLTIADSQLRLGQINRRVPDVWTMPDQGRNLGVLVLYTERTATLKALRYAATLPHANRAPVRLLVPQVVPYPLPLQQPAVQPSILARQFGALAEEAEVEATVEILLCRDSWTAVHKALAVPHLVVIGNRRHWWPTAESRLAKRLRAEGHYVILTESN